MSAQTSVRYPWERWLGGALWLGACLVLSYLVMSYDFAPGRLGPRRTRWPSDTMLQRTSGQPTVVAFLHPRCVCTRATVKQLVRTVNAHPGAELIASVFVPLSATDLKTWEDSEYVQTIRAAVPDARIVYDRSGIEARRFGAYTSGTVLVYDIPGQEIFRGGITDRRGGERDNPGLQRLASAMTQGDRSIPADSTPVFGCPLVLPNDVEKEATAQ